MLQVNIANDIEREFWNSNFFTEASYYQIVVKNEIEHSIIEYQKGENHGICCL